MLRQSPLRHQKMDSCSSSSPLCYLIVLTSFSGFSGEGIAPAVSLTGSELSSYTRCKEILGVGKTEMDV